MSCSERLVLRREVAHELADIEKRTRQRLKETKDARERVLLEKQLRRVQKALAMGDLAK